MVSNAWSSERVQHDGHDGADRRLAGDGLDRCRDEPPMVRRGRCARRVSVGSGTTLIFTGPGSDGIWFTDDDVQSGYGANEIIYCGYRYNPETQLYYVRNRTYNPILGRWIQRDPIGYSGGVNLYEYVGGKTPISIDPLGQDCLVSFACHLVNSSTHDHGCVRECHYQCIENHRANVPGTGSIIACWNLPPGKIVTADDRTFWNLACFLTLGLCGRPGKCPRSSTTQKMYYAPAGGSWGNCSRMACRADCARTRSLQEALCNGATGHAAVLACKAAATTEYLFCVSICNAFCKHI